MTEHPEATDKPNLALEGLARAAMKRIGGTVSMTRVAEQEGAGPRPGGTSFHQRAGARVLKQNPKVRPTFTMIQHYGKFEVKK